MSLLNQSNNLPNLWIKLLHNFSFFCASDYAQAHQLQKNERDQSIQALFTKHNLGRVGALPLSNEVAVKHLERATNRLDELSRDHEQQKVPYSSQAFFDYTMST